MQSRTRLARPTTGIWVFGLYSFRGQYTGQTLWSTADVWTRYTLAMPAAVLTAIGLVAQQRAFRRSGLIRFGQDALWAAITFAWYGLFGQIFSTESPLVLSQYVNEEAFQQIFGFPVQMFRALTAVAAAVFVIRFLRAFQVETERKIAELQTARLEESRQRETMRAELFRRVVAAEEAERQRIARDLHDETGQSLTAIGMGLRMLLRDPCRIESPGRRCRRDERALRRKFVLARRWPRGSERRCPADGLVDRRDEWPCCAGSPAA